MFCVRSHTGPQFIVSSEGLLGRVESALMLTPGENIPLNGNRARVVRLRRGSDDILWDKSPPEGISSPVYNPNLSIYSARSSSLSESQEQAAGELKVAGGEQNVDGLGSSHESDFSFSSA